MDQEHITSAKSHSELFRVDDSDLRMVNRLLLLCAIGLIALVAWRVQQMGSRLREEDPTRTGTAYKPVAIDSFDSEETYVAAVSGRNIMVPARGASQVVTGDEDSQTRAEILNELNRAKREFLVVGVAWRPAQVVMIYDNKKKLTYQVQVGQTIGDTDIVVESIDRLPESIERYSVTISLQDERMAL